MSTNRPDRLPDAVSGCLEACRRCEVVIDTVLAQNPAKYSAVGPHLRHCIDHFRLLLDGWPAGRVDYDARERDERSERDPEAMRGALRRAAQGLAAIGGADLGRELRVSQSAAPGAPPLESDSRLERELVFLSGHTIHHIAIMVLAARASGIEVADDLAVAFSTEAHRATMTAKR